MSLLLNHHCLPLRQVVHWPMRIETRNESELRVQGIVETAEGDLLEVLVRSGESIEAEVRRTLSDSNCEDSASFPLDAEAIVDWKCTIWKLDEPQRSFVKARLQVLLERLKLPDGPRPRTSAQYNFLRRITPYRRQAIEAYPWLLDALCDRLVKPPEYPVAPLLETIDSGQPLNPALARMFGVRESVIRKLHTLPRELMATPEFRWGSNLLQSMSPMLDMLERMPAEKIPATDAGRKWLWYVLHWARHLLCQDFRAEIAANVYRSLPNPLDGTELLNRLGDRMDRNRWGQLRSYFLQVTGYQGVRSIDTQRRLLHDTPYLADKILEWALEHRGPRWLLNLHARLRRNTASGKQSIWLGIIVPHFDTHFTSGRWVGFRSIHPIVSLRQMQAEGDEMRNCLSNYDWMAMVHDCGLFLFSVRDRRNRLMAHLSVIADAEEEWRLSQIEGPGNRNADSHSQRAAEAFVAELNTRKPPLVKPESGQSRSSIPDLGISQLVDAVMRDFNLEKVSHDEFRPHIL